MPVQCMYNVCIVYVQCMYCVCTMYVLCMYNVCIVYVQCMYRVCTMYVLCMYNVCIVPVQCMYRVCIYEGDRAPLAKVSIDTNVMVTDEALKPTNGVLRAHMRAPTHTS